MAGPLAGPPRAAADRANPPLIILLAALLALLSTGLSVPEPVAADTDGRPKAVVIVGPVGGQTASFLATGRRVAHQAQAAGMDVRRIFHPHATWKRVLAAIQGAHLVVYVGHGNGWPSPYGPFQEDTKNGFGLNPSMGMSSSQVEYHGANQIRSKVRLARGAVVLLYRLCYAAGNAEPWMGIERDRGVAARRVDGFAAGFLRAGAATVFAFGHEQRVNIPKALTRTDMTMDGIFRLRGSRGANDGFQGWKDVRIASRRTRGARIHLDPHRTRGYHRAVTGRLEMTAAQWRGSSGGKADGDRTRPRLSRVRIASRGPLDPATIRMPQFSPDGDGISDRLRFEWRVSEKAGLRATIRNARGRVVRTLSRRPRQGRSSLAWDGRSDSGKRVADGVYRIELAARDGAGNVSRPRILRAKLSTTLRGYRLSRNAIHTSDRDGLARRVRLRVDVTRRASVGWRIESADGRVVRTLRARSVPPGRHVRGWNGRDRSGSYVSPGWYTATVVARTPAGGIRYQRRIWVGPFRIEGDRVAARGARVSLTYVATERLGQPPPTVRVKQPGVAAYELRTRKVARNGYRLSFKPRSRGKAGRLRLLVVGTDKEGGKERVRHALHLR